jgi:hypothetical protein
MVINRVVCFEEECVRRIVLPIWIVPVPRSSVVYGHGAMRESEYHSSYAFAAFAETADDCE